MQSRRIGCVLRDTRGSVIWFTGNPVVVAVHAFSIAGFSAIDGSGAGRARIVATAPLIACLRRPLAHHADVNCDFLRVAHERLLPFRVCHRPSTASNGTYQACRRQIATDRRRTPSLVSGH